MVFKEANKTMTLEFYANARFFGRRYESYVRGKDIDFSPQAINDLLNIVQPEQCDVQRRRDTCGGWNEEQWDEVKSLLCVEGAQWQGSKQMLCKSDFKSVAKAWPHLWCRHWWAPRALLRFHCHEYTPWQLLWMVALLMLVS